MKKILQAIGNLFNLVVITKEEYTKITETPPTIGVETPTTLLSYPQIISMLKAYDDKKLSFNKEKNQVFMKGLENEDTRVSTFRFTEMKNYINHTEKIASEKGITLKGIAFVKGLYNEKNTHNKNFIGYESLLYLPTAMIDGKETLIDLANSTKNNLLSFKTALAENGYMWRYDSEEDYVTLSKKINLEQKQIVNKALQKSSNSNLVLVANMTNVAPPHDS